MRLCLSVYICLYIIQWFSLFSHSICYFLFCATKPLYVFFFIFFSSLPFRNLSYSRQKRYKISTNNFVYLCFLISAALFVRMRFDYSSLFYHRVIFQYERKHDQFKYTGVSCHNKKQRTLKHFLHFTLKIVFSTKLATPCTQLVRLIVFVLM